jgi:hypothetical protein
MTVPSFSTATQWHKLKLDGVTIPGVAKVDADLDDMRDKQKAAGGNKTRTRNKGSKGVKLKVEIALADDQEASEFEQIAVPILRKRSNAAAPDPHIIVHPMAAFWGIDKVTVGKISSPSPNSKDGMKISFELDEWAPEPKEARQPTEKPKPEPTTPTTPPPTLAELAQFNALGVPGTPG